MKFLIKLYPACWRRRYGGELEVLLEDSGSGCRDVWDLLRGAMQMQMKTWSFWRIVTVCGMAGALLAVAAAFSMPYRYQSTAILKTSPARSTAYWDTLATEAFTPQSLSAIVRQEHLYADASPEDSIDRFRRGIRIATVAPDLAQVSFAYEDPIAVQRVSQALIGRLITANLTTSVVKASEPLAPGARLEVLQSPGRPKKQVAKLGLASLPLPLGLLFGVALALILRRRAASAKT